MIIDVIKKNPTATISEMAEMPGKSTRGIKKQLAELKSKGIVIRLGSYKDGYHVVINEESN
jgi:predicted HTH transcriptional regulator